MTILAPLVLDGVGTPLVESMASYFLRLTYAHQVRPNQLTQVICNESEYLRAAALAPQLRSRALYPAMFCSHSAQTEVLVARIQRLTGQNNLAFGTFLRLRDNICRNQTGAISEQRRWCPKCYSSLPLQAPEPLAWQLPLITRCPIHNVLLEDACTHCGIPQLPWRADDARRYCFKCKRPLTGCRSDDAEPTPWEKWCQSESLRLLDHIASPASSEYCQGAVKEFLAALPPPTLGARGNAAHGPEIGHFRDAMSKCPQRLPRLITLFRIAASWGTTPLEILLCPREAASLNMFSSNSLIPKTQPKRPFRKENYDKCERRLRALIDLSEEILLPPASHVCREFKVSISSFMARRREAWNAYLAEKSRRLKQHKERGVQLAISYMDKLIVRLQTSGERLHRHRAIAQTVSDIRVSTTVARSALRLSLRQMRMRRDTVKERASSKF